MKTKFIALMVILSSLFTTGYSQKENSLDAALQALKTSLEKRDFAALEPFLDQTYKVADYSRPTADKLLPQIISQNPGLVGFNIMKKDVKADKTTVEIEYEVEGHLIGTDKSTSRCVLTPTNKFVTIEFFDEVMAKAKVVRSH